MRFIFGIKGRDGVEDAKTKLGLIPLHKRRDQRLRLLMRILAKEEHHTSLSESYNEIIKATFNDYDNEITDTWDPSYLPN